VARPWSGCSRQGLRFAQAHLCPTSPAPHNVARVVRPAFVSFDCRWRFGRWRLDAFGRQGDYVRRNSRIFQCCRCRKDPNKRSYSGSPIVAASGSHGSKCERSLRQLAAPPATHQIASYPHHQLQLPTQYNLLPVRMNRFPCETPTAARSLSSPSSPRAVVCRILNSAAAATTKTSPRKFWK
jgi:hypothetical protein